MERQVRIWAACGLLMITATTGCRSMGRSSVPPGPKYSADGRQQPGVSFSSDPHAANQAGNPSLGGITNMAPGGTLAGGSGAPQLGTPGPNSNPYGVPGGAAFGGPGTSGAAPSLNAGGGGAAAPGAAAGYNPVTPNSGPSGAAMGFPGAN
jgi:hypothetical protein